jgi:hypothetical protein
MANDLYNKCKESTNLDKYPREDRLAFYESARDDLDASRSKIQIRIAYRSLFRQFKMLDNENIKLREENEQQRMIIEQQNILNQQLIDKSKVENITKSYSSVCS